jgi:hypothetical protein
VLLVSACQFPYTIKLWHTVHTFIRGDVSTSRTKTFTTLQLSMARKNLILTAVHWPKICNPDSEQIGIVASTVLPVTIKNDVSEIVLQAVRQNVSLLLTEFQTVDIKDVTYWKNVGNSMTVLNYAPQGKLNII